MLCILYRYALAEYLKKLLKQNNEVEFHEEKTIERIRKFTEDFNTKSLKYLSD